MTGEIYLRALEYATLKHSGQKRIGGEDYITHPVAVAKMLGDRGYGDEYILTGLFHDLLEDTDADEKSILDIAGSEVLNAVKTLTKYPGYNMEDYVKGVYSTELTKAVKTADRLHNLKCAVCTGEDFKTYYIDSTLKWFLTLSPEIVEETEKLICTLSDDNREIYQNKLILRKQEVIINV